MAFLQLILIVMYLRHYASFAYVTVLSATIMEERPPNTLISDISHLARRVQSRDDDASLHYAVLPQSASLSEYFDVNYSTGEVRTKMPFDRDRFVPNGDDCVILFHLAVVKPRFEPFDLQIIVEDLNDNTPTFPSSIVTISASEASVIGKRFPLPLAVDPDSPAFSVQSYVLLDNTKRSLFSLYEKKIGSHVDSLSLELLRHLDRERLTSLTMHVLAIDGGKPQRTGTLTVEVVIVDENDNEPQFDMSFYEVTLSEDTAPGTIIAHLHADDLDVNDNGRIRYEFGPMSHDVIAHVFALHNTTGDVFLLQRLQYHLRQSYTFFVDAYDHGIEPLSARTKVLVNVIDVNDHAPEITLMSRDSFQAQSSLKDIKQEESSFVALVYVEDKDFDQNRIVNCFVDNALFRLEKMDDNYYKVHAIKPLSRESADNMSVVVSCVDNGKPPLRATSSMKLHLRDANDHAPHFETNLYVVTSRENLVNVSVITVRATDDDPGESGEIAYYMADGLMGDYFAVDRQNGLVGLVKPLDFEKFRSVQFSVVATDKGRPPRSSSVTILVHVINTNDEWPKFSHRHYVFRIRESAAIGTVVGKLGVTDKDEPPYNKWKFLPLQKNETDGRFVVDIVSGMLSVNELLDREAVAYYNFTVFVCDQMEPYWTSSALVSVFVDDVNDNAPSFVNPPASSNVTVYVPCSAGLNHQVIQLLANDPDDIANAQIRYYDIMQSANNVLAVDSSTGLVTTVRNVSSVCGQLRQLVVSAVDSGSPRLSSIVVLTVAFVSFDNNETMLLSNSSAQWTFSMTHVAFLLLTGKQEVLIAIIVAGIITCFIIIGVAILAATAKRKRAQAYSKKRSRQLGKAASSTTNGKFKAGQCKSNGLNVNGNACKMAMKSLNYIECPQDDVVNFNKVSTFRIFI